ncbi:MAG: c-type cytochrome [Xanthobacteraceae bacterium]|nr:c-type cytochrome [Xanthobacteraceae bacterium]
MLRIVIAVGACLLAASTAIAETPVERGNYLVNSIMACGNCHSPRDAEGKLIADKALSGGLAFNTPPFVATAPNITADKETGIGSWSDAEIKRALIEGARPDHGRLAGVPLAAIMPANFYKALLPEDLDAVVAYLRSVKPVRNQVPDPVYRAPVRRDPYPDADAGFSKAMLADPVKRGAYLVTIGHCMECHSAWSRGVSDFKGGLGGGGRVLPPREGTPEGTPGTVVPNITAHPTAGLGGWSDAEIIRAVTHGVARDGRPLKPPMAYGYYAGLKNSDQADIVAYLRTVPALP